MQPYNNYQYLKLDSTSNAVEEKLSFESDTTTNANPFSLQTGNVFNENKYRNICFWNGNTSANSYRHIIGCQQFGNLKVQSITPNSTDNILSCEKGIPNSTQVALFQVNASANISKQPFHIFDINTTSNPGYVFNQSDQAGYRTILAHDNNNSFASVFGPFSHVFSNNAGNVMHVHSNQTSGASDNSNIAMISIGTIASPTRLFVFHANGVANCSSTWTNGGADLGEMYEWEDGNPDNENRIGKIVTFVPGTDKIKCCGENDIPIGVTKPSETVAFLGRNNMDWYGKELRDEYGSILRNHDNSPVINPDYDPKKDYTMRTERKEWAAVGLVGLCVINNDQDHLVPFHWIKLNETSDKTTKYFVK